LNNEAVATWPGAASVVGVAGVVVLCFILSIVAPLSKEMLLKK